jgi:hypothetical protein
MLPLISTLGVIMPYIVGVGVFSFTMFIGYLVDPNMRRLFNRIFGK